MSEDKLVFVVGVWRSGTTLLHGILNQHPHVALMFEAQPFALWPRTATHRLAEDWAQRLDFFNQAITRHRLDPSTLPSSATTRDASLALFRSFARGRGAHVMGGKSPHYHFCLPQIARVFPEASFVIIWRDPGECCRSVAKLKRARAFGRRGMLSRTLFGSVELARGTELLRRQGRGIHDIVYTELLNNPEGELRRLCDFLSIPFDPAMLELKRVDLSTMSPGLQTERNLSSPVNLSAQKADILSPGFAAKVRRYATLWRSEFAHHVLARALSGSAGDPEPSVVEQLIDRSTYLFWRGFDELKREMLYRMPLSWWRWIRSRLESAEAVSTKQASQQASREQQTAE